MPSTPTARQLEVLALLRALTPRAIGLTLLFSVLCAIALNPLFETPFTVVLGRTLFVGFVTLVARGAASLWRPRFVAPWLLQSITVALAAIAATLAAYRHLGLTPPVRAGHDLFGAPPEAF